MKKCKKCKNLYNDNYNFCPNCGSAKIVTFEDINKNNQGQAIAHNIIRRKKRHQFIVVLVVTVLMIVIISVLTNVNKDRDETQISFPKEPENVGINQPANTTGKEIQESKNLTIYLTDLEHLSNDSWIYCEPYEMGTTNIGTEVYHRIYAGRYSSTGSSTSYFLDGKYKKIEGIWFIEKSGKDTETVNSFIVYADELEVYKSPSLTKGDLPIEFDINLNSCEVLKIVFAIEGLGPHGAAEIGEIKLAN